MIFSTNIFLNKSSLFDFDLTFIAELSLFTILALVVTFKFIAPISKEIDSRAEFINYNLKKNVIFSCDEGNSGPELSDAYELMKSIGYKEK